MQVNAHWKMFSGASYNIPHRLRSVTIAVSVSVFGNHAISTSQEEPDAIQQLRGGGATAIFAHPTLRLAWCKKRANRNLREPFIVLESEDPLSARR